MVKTEGKAIGTGLLVSLLIIGACVYFLFDPLETGWMPQCLFHKVTGLQCMGCGTQRMLHSLLHGDFSGAFRANAFVTLSLPAILFYVVLELRRERYPDLYRLMHGKGVIITTAALLFAWLLIRNFLGI